MRLKSFLLVLSLLFLPMLCCAGELPDTVWSRRTAHGQICGVSFSPDSKYIASAIYANDGNNITIYSADSGKIIKTIDAMFGYHFPFVLHDVEFSKTGKYLMFAGENGFTLLDGSTYDLIKRIPYLDLISTWVWASISPDEKNIAFVYGAVLNIWDIETGDTILTNNNLAPPDNIGNHPSVAHIQYSPDGNHIAYTMTDNYLRLFDIAGDSIDFVYKTNGWALKYSPDGTMIAFSSAPGNAVQVMNPETKEIIMSIPGYSSGVADIDISSDNKYIAVSFGGDIAKLEIWDLQTKTLLHTYIKNPKAPFESISISNDLNYIVDGISSSIQLFYFKDIISDVDEKKINPSIIFPNPSENNIQLKFYLNQPNNVKIDLTDMNGNIAGTLFNGLLFEGNQNKSFNLQNYPSGTYLLQIQSGKTISTQKIIISK